MSGGAPPGNQNAVKGREWRNAIRRALEKRGNGDRTAALDALAEKLLEQADTGDIPALREFGDRMDGKPAQAIIGGDPDDPAIRVERIERVIVKP